MNSFVTPSPNLLEYLTVALKMVEAYCSPLFADAATLISPIYKFRSNDINSFFDRTKNSEPSSSCRLEMFGELFQRISR
jgi:hypothetical protein